jgi:hypothetical protein
MQQKDKQETRRSDRDDERTFEPCSINIDVDDLGALLAERNRKVLDMLAEYDRRQEKRKHK